MRLPINTAANTSIPKTGAFFHNMSSFCSWNGLRHWEWRRPGPQVRAFSQPYRNFTGKCSVLFLLFVLTLLAGNRQPDQAQSGNASRQNPGDQVITGSGNVCKRGLLIGNLSAFIRQIRGGSLLIGDVGAFVRQIRSRGILVGNTVSSPPSPSPPPPLLE